METETLPQQSSTYTSEQTSLLVGTVVGTKESKEEVNCCAKLTSWRGSGGANGSGDTTTNQQDRKKYKLLCSLFLIVEFVSLGYIYLSQDKFLLVFFTLFTMLKFLSEVWGQETATWVCPNGPFLFVMVYIIGMPSVGYNYTICMSKPNIPSILFGIIPRNLLAAILFSSGTTYAWTYELLRFQWKKNPINKGRLHTIHQARYHIHPNYFGDLFTYSGWALAVGTTCALSLPLSLLCILIICICPNSDAYLAKRYSNEFPEYSKKTATIVPFVTSKMANYFLALVGFVVSLYYYPTCGGQCGLSTS